MGMQRVPSSDTRLQRWSDRALQERADCPVSEHAPDRDSQHFQTPVFKSFGEAISAR